MASCTLPHSQQFWDPWVLGLSWVTALLPYLNSAKSKTQACSSAQRKLPGLGYVNALDPVVFFPPSKCLAFSVPQCNAISVWVGGGLHTKIQFSCPCIKSLAKMLMSKLQHYDFLSYSPWWPLVQLLGVSLEDGLSIGLDENWVLCFVHYPSSVGLPSLSLLRTTGCCMWAEWLLV